MLDVRIIYWGFIIVLLVLKAISVDISVTQLMWF